MIDNRSKVLIIGANDNASATALRLFRAGFHVSLVSAQQPFDLHYFRNFSSVLSMGSKEINGVKAQSFADFLFHSQQDPENYSLQMFIDFLFNDRKISVLSVADFEQVKIGQFKFCVICDAFLYKKLQIRSEVNISCVTDIKAEYMVMAKGDYLGNVKYIFLDIPFYEDEEMRKNLIFSQEMGLFIAEKSPGEKVKSAERIAKIDDWEITAPFDGVVEGVIPSGVFVTKEMAVISILDDPKYNSHILPSSCFSIGGGVLEAIMFHKTANLL